MSATAGKVSAPVAVDERDSAAVARFLAGDEGGFEDLYARHGGKVRAYCATWNEREVEDLAQEAWMRVSVAMRAGYVPLNFPGWLREVTTWACVDYLRRGRHRVIGGDGDVLGDEALDQAAAPEEPLNVIRLALARNDQITARQREALEMRLDGHTLEEIGGRLGITKVAAHLLVKRAVMTLEVTE